MCDLGEQLRKLRSDKGLSLHKVYESTGITNSRLSKAENGAWNNLKLSELRMLADLYEARIIPMCLMAGLFDRSEVEEYHSCFQNVELLDDEDKRHIQTEIDYILKKKGCTK